MHRLKAVVVALLIVTAPLPRFPSRAIDALSDVVLFEGARLIAGDGSAPIENSAFTIENGRFTQIGARGGVRVPTDAARVDLSGKTVMPTIIDAHVHLGYRKGLSFSADNYTRENLLDELNRFAYHGVAAVLEAGTGRGDLPFQLRSDVRAGTLYRTAARGLAMPNAGPGGPMRDAAYGVKTEAEARQDVRALAAKKVDLIKIWVDDRDGTVEKLKPNLYRAIIDEAHRRNLRVMAHIVDLADAKDLLLAGVDVFAHVVRDKDIDNELIAMLKQRPHVFFVETLWGERRAIYGTRPEWLDEPLLHETLSAEEIRELAESFSSGAVEASQRARAQRLMRNVAKLGAAGVKLGLGTDTGGVTGGQYFGLASHIEMELMVKSGLTPTEVITAATHNSAQILGLKQRGTMAPGMSADFIVLDANPLENIANTRRISKIYMSGRGIDRTALKSSWTGSRSQ
jgi:imidazolonepropionase-like amidohydrolase